MQRAMVTYLIPLRCDECGNHVIQRGNELVCTTCGLVHPATQGTPILNSKKTKLGSIIGPGRKGRISVKARVRYTKLRSLQNEVGCRSVDIRADLLRVVRILGLPDDLALKALKRQERINLPYMRVVVSAACLMAILRERGIPISLRQLLCAYKEMGRKITMKTVIALLSTMTKSRLSAQDYIDKVMDGLRVDGSIAAWSRRYGTKKYLREVEDLARRMLSGASPRRTSGKNPHLLACSAVFAAMLRLRKRTGVEVTRCHFAKVTGTTEFTIRLHMRIFAPRRARFWRRKMEICYGCGLRIGPLENTVRDEEGNIWHEDCYWEQPQFSSPPPDASLEVKNNAIGNLQGDLRVPEL